MSDIPPPAQPYLPAHWHNYIWQSLLATGAVFIALAALTVQDLVLVVSIAATAFTVYAMPSSLSARPRNVIGGTLVALALGSCFSLVPSDHAVLVLFVRSATVGMTTLIMSVTRTEHPPAAGTALGVVTAGLSVRLIFGVVLGVVIISLIQQLLRPFLRDLAGRCVGEKKRPGQPPQSTQ